MINQEIDLTTKDGLMNTFITYPEENGPHPILIFLMDAWGKREELHDMARRFGTAGYYVILPNLYYRRTREFFRDESNTEKMFQHMNSLTNALVCEDIQILFDYLKTDKNARLGKCGCIGYCMSGPFAFSAAAKFPELITAAASIHGIRLFTDDKDSPHLTAKDIKGEIYFGCAETDEYAPKEMIDSLDKYLSNIGINYRIEWYPGAIHGFVFPSRIERFNKESAERHWERMLAMLARCL